MARNVDVSGGPLRLPGELRWLEWPECHAPSVEFDQSSNKIVYLNLEESFITKIEGKGFKELKYVKLSRCFNLTTLDEAVGSHENLVKLRVDGCDSLEKVSSLLRSKHIKKLDFDSCPKLNKLPAFKEELKYLKHLRLRGTALKELPESIGNLIALESLDMSDCQHLSIIPHSIYKLRSLKKLYLVGCPKLEWFPRRLVGSASDVLGLPNLKDLFLGDCRLKDLEFLEDLTCFRTLNSLDLSGNEFARVPGCLRKFEELKDVNLSGCMSLTTLDEAIGLPNLKDLILSNCRLKDLEFLEGLTCFETLDSLDLSGNEFACVPRCLRKFKNLQRLKLRDCRSLLEVQELPSELIRHVDANGCFNLNTFPRLHTLIFRSWRSNEVDLSGCGLGRNFMVESLPLEKFRGFTGGVSVVCTANELPQWVNFQTTECGSSYQVSLPGSMSEDEILGLTLFITVDNGCIRFDDWQAVRRVAQVVVGGKRFSIGLCEGKPIHTWFLYIPRQPILGYYVQNWRSITLEFPKQDKLEFHSLGLRMLCKREEDDQRIRVHKIERIRLPQIERIESNDRDSWASESESVEECLCESDYESESSEW